MLRNNWPLSFLKRRSSVGGGGGNAYGLVGVSSAPGDATGSGAQTVNVPYPAGIAVNDIAVVDLMVVQGSSPVSYSGLPSGWAEYAHDAYGTGAYHHYMFWKRLDGTETGNFSLSVTAGGATSLRFGMMSVWGGCVTAGDPFVSKVNNTGSSVNCASAALTTSENNQIVVNLVGRTDANATFTPPAGYTEGYDVSNAAGSSLDGSSTMNYKVIASAGAVGSVTTVASTSGRWGVISFGLDAA